MSTEATLNSFFKTSTTPGTPVVLGASTLKMQSVRLLGWRADGILNVGNVKWRANGGAWSTIEPGTEETIIEGIGYVRASTIEIDVANSGDGVQVKYVQSVTYTAP